MLRDAEGAKVRRGDQAGRVAALSGLLAKQQAEIRAGDSVTVSDLCNAFVEWHRANSSAPRTVADHTYHLRRFAAFSHGGVLFWDRPASSITPEDLWRVKAAGLGSLRLLYASVLACWAWGAKAIEGRVPARLLQSNPLTGISKPRRGQVKAKLVPWRTTRALLRFARARAKHRPLRFRKAATYAAERLRVLCLHTIAATGCRPFEAAALRWDEIDWQERIIAVHAARDKGRRQGRAPTKPRRLAVPANLLRALAKVRAWPGAHPVYVFVPAGARFEGSPKPRELWRWWRDELKPAALAAGVPIPPDATLYWFRHEWQTTGLEVDTAEGVAAAAGNSASVLHSAYEHTRNKRIREVADKVAQQRRGKG